jgi:hypothetical protein
VETWNSIIVRLTSVGRHCLAEDGHWSLVVSRWQTLSAQCCELRRLPNDERPATNDRLACVKLFVHTKVMLFSKEYVGYLAREVSKKLVASGLIETKAMPALNEKVHAALLEELALEDRINDEVRVILEAYSEEMQKSGANYQEMFRKVKTELVKKYKAVL